MGSNSLDRRACEVVRLRAPQIQTKFLSQLIVCNEQLDTCPTVAPTDLSLSERCPACVTTPSS
jgi:hypothetical protein